MKIQQTSFGFTKKVFAFDTETFESQVCKNGSYLNSCTIIKFARRQATSRRAAWRGTATVLSKSELTYEQFRDSVSRLYASYAWDGEEVWGYTKLKEQVELADYLNPLLESCPELPERFDAWWEELPIEPRNINSIQSPLDKVAF